MAARRPPSGRTPTPPPDVEVESPDVGRSYSDSFLYKILLDVQKSQGAAEQAISHLTSSVERQGQKMAKVEDLRIDVAKMNETLGQLSKDVAAAKDKLDTVRLWIAGAAAIVALVAVIGVPTILRFWPPQPPPVASTVPTSPMPTSAPSGQGTTIRP